MKTASLPSGQVSAERASVPYLHTSKKRKCGKKKRKVLMHGEHAKLLINSLQKQLFQS